MKRSLPVALASSSALLALFSLPVSAQDYCAMDMASFIQLPDGSCVSTNYMSVRGVASESAESIGDLYQQASDFYQETRRADTSWSYSDYESYSSSSYRNNYTDEDRGAAAELAAETGVMLDEAVASYNSIILLTTPEERAALSRVSGTMISR